MPPNEDEGIFVLLSVAARVNVQWRVAMTKIWPRQAGCVPFSGSNRGAA